MADQLVNIAYFFKHPEGFPWDVLGLSRPYVGPMHSYMCEAAALYSDPNIKYLLLGKASFSEIKRFAEHYDGVFKDIAVYCAHVEDTNCRFMKAKLVILWLRSQQGFLAHMQKRLDSLYRQGLLSLPEGARPGS